MKCSKCDKEVDISSKFCNNCGEKIEENSTLKKFDETMKISFKVWYILGYANGVHKENKESLEKFEKLIRTEHSEVWEWYQEVVEYWKKELKQHNEENKKTNGSKRACISETKGNKN